MGGADFRPTFFREDIPMTHTLTHPEYFTLTSPEGTPLRGADQDWFRTYWQRRAGCGPTTSATILAYLSRVFPRLNVMAPSGNPTPEDFVSYMETLWRYVTPGTRGLDKPENLLLGCRSFALSRGCYLTGQVLAVPALDEGERPTEKACRDFLATALDKNCPVAFLNYSCGDLTNLDSWHWVPLIAMEEAEGKLLCTILDGCEERVVDFSLWLKSTPLGGALVVLEPEPGL